MGRQVLPHDIFDWDLAVPGDPARAGGRRARRRRRQDGLASTRSTRTTARCCGSARSASTTATTTTTSRRCAATPAAGAVSVLPGRAGRRQTPMAADDAHASTCPSTSWPPTIDRQIMLPAAGPREGKADGRARPRDADACAGTAVCRPASYGAATVVERPRLHDDLRRHALGVATRATGRVAWRAQASGRHERAGRGRRRHACSRPAASRLKAGQRTRHRRVPAGAMMPRRPPRRRMRTGDAPVAAAAHGRVCTPKCCAACW